MQNEIDKGRCLPYGSLSHRRKCMRTVWGGTLLLILVWWIVPPDRVLLGIKRDIFLAIFVLGFAYRALSSFRRWTNGKNLPLENRRR